MEHNPYFQKRCNENKELQELNKLAEEELECFEMEGLKLWHFWFYKVNKGVEEWYLPQTGLIGIFKHNFNKMYNKEGFDILAGEVFIKEQMYVYISIGTTKSEEELLDFKNELFKDLSDFFEKLGEESYNKIIEIYVENLKLEEKIKKPNNSVLNRIYSNLNEKDDEKHAAFIKKLSKVSKKPLNTCKFFEGGVFYAMKFEIK